MYISSYVDSTKDTAASEENVAIIKDVIGRTTKDSVATKVQKSTKSSDHEERELFDEERDQYEEKGRSKFSNVYCNHLLLDMNIKLMMIFLYIFLYFFIFLLRAFLIKKNNLLEKVSNFSGKCIQINIKRKIFEQTKECLLQYSLPFIESKYHNFDKHIKQDRHGFKIETTKTVKKKSWIKLFLS
ncbi:hypothetical protein RFI_25836 [Reticulomyxa filosa]|uniref:Uncharacterized protein n=1 Tax=Reticulomyxa filosa TaxID=46433 RepID=X6MCE9_RETFI|nr:hypothetical protein RFI_25836 [Reticulomyxa filosa]|eukprot:ETO11539.1 hypothetical protein RFI_25836 [Reticulomyxa filosa]